MALLFPLRILIALIVPVMSGIVRFSLTLLCTSLHNLHKLFSRKTMVRIRILLLLCLLVYWYSSFVGHLFRSIESAHTSDEIYPISWVSRLSSAGIHVPIISTMRIIVLTKLGVLHSEKSFCRLHPMRGLYSLPPSVGSVSVTPNYNVTCILVLTHVISSPGNFMIPLSALFLFLCRTRH